MPKLTENWRLLLFSSSAKENLSSGTANIQNLGNFINYSFAIDNIFSTGKNWSLNPNYNE